MTSSELMSFLGISILAGFVFFFAMSMKILKEYERAVILRLGKYIKTKGPGPIFITPIIDKIIKVDLRTQPIDVPRQEIITKDNVSAIVDAVLYYKVENPAKAILEVHNFVEAIFLIAQTTLRSVLGQIELDDILSEREKINKSLHAMIDDQVNQWGLTVLMVELKELALPEEMKRAMARQAEVERERRALVISAEGEYQASHKLKQAAEVISAQPIAIQLRYLQTLADISVGKSSTIVFPVPLNMFDKLFAGNKERD